jgi:hypothetical protein
MKTKRIYLGRLRSEAHYQFLSIVKQLIDTDTPVSTLLADLLPHFDTLLTLEGKLVDAMQGSSLTKELSDADQRRDRALTGINSIINAALHHFDSTIVQAASRLRLRIKAFHGEVEKKSYEEEAAAIRILVADLKTSYATDVTTLTLVAWVAELDAAQTVFDAIFLARNAELSERPQEKLRDVRRELGVSYTLMVDRIDAHNLVDAGAYDTFISLLNQNVDYFNEHAPHRIKMDFSKGDHTVIELIETQYYTGKPITPIPVVYYREEGRPTREPALGRDFSVTYKNNINVGMAELTIHGKSSYTGSKTVTFIIAHKTAT